MTRSTRGSAHRSLSFGRNAWLVIAGLVIFSASLDLVHASLANHIETQSVPWNFALYRTVIFWIAYVPLVPSAFFLADRFRLDRDTRRASLVIHVLAALAFAYLHTICSAALDPLRLNSGGALLPRIFRAVRLNFPIDFVSYWAIVGVTYAFHYHSESEERRTAAARLETEAAVLERNLTETRLRALQSQLNPHFFFNTLNAISVLARKGENQAVIQMLARLSQLLRLCLNDKRPQHISLSHEMEFLDIYLDIQQLWFGDRLTVRRNIAEDALDASVPSMILQPLVENAIVHGIAGARGEGCIAIEAARENGTLRLQVIDSGPGFGGSAATRGMGTGLANTRARLEQLYGSAHRIEYREPPGGGASVTISIPFSRVACGLVDVEPGAPS